MNELIAPTSSSLYGPDGRSPLPSRGEESDHKLCAIPSSMPYIASINALILICLWKTHQMSSILRL